MSGQPPAIYLDHNATTPLDPEVAEAMVRHLGTFGNPSSRHPFGEEARELVQQAVPAVARWQRQVFLPLDLVKHLRELGRVQPDELTGPLLTAVSEQPGVSGDDGGSCDRNANCGSYRESHTDSSASQPTTPLHDQCRRSAD